jgi:hypothetical protein
MLTVRKQVGLFVRDGRKAYEIADAVFADIIARLHRDPRFRGVKVSDLELLLADARENRTPTRRCASEWSTSNWSTRR